MPSIEESKRQVNAALQRKEDLDHDAILASLQDEIDRHNERDNDADGRRHAQRRHRSRSPASARFRFKSNMSKPPKRKHRSKDGEHHRHRRNRLVDRDATSEAAHPFPREPTNPDRNGQQDADAAFRESLFDALADDEGAAYWESVYSQPIHVYPRPTVETATGELEQMTDEQYAAHVQTKMWEKKNPQIVLERERKEKERKEEEQDRARRRAEFIRRKERAAWERAQRDGTRKFAGLEEGRDEDYEYVFDFDGGVNGASGSFTSRMPKNEEHHRAWTDYCMAWDRLKIELLNARDAGSVLPSAVKEMPWPVLGPKPVTKPNIEDFIRHIPAEDGRSKVQLLKLERVKWHPDKIQQRFGGHVDEGTMKVVTGVFHVVDAALEEERKRDGK